MNISEVDRANELEYLVGPWISLGFAGQRGLCWLAPTGRVFGKPSPWKTLRGAASMAEEHPPFVGGVLAGVGGELRHTETNSAFVPGRG